MSTILKLTITVVGFESQTVEIPLSDLPSEPATAPLMTGFDPPDKDELSASHNIPRCLCGTSIRDLHPADRYINPDDPNMQYYCSKCRDIGHVISGLKASLRCATQELEGRREEIRALTEEREIIYAENASLSRDIKAAFAERVAAEVRAEKAEKKAATSDRTILQYADEAYAKAPMTEQQARGILAQHSQPCACETCDAARRVVAKG